MPRRALTAAVSLVLGCSDYNVDALDVPKLPSSADCLDVRPRRIDFADHEVMVDAVQEFVVTVHNRCSQAVALWGPQLTGDRTSFEADALPSELAPGGEATLQVRFVPRTDGEVAATLRIGSDTPIDGKVALSGRGRAPVLHTSVEHLDFGAGHVGCERTHTVVLSNLGSLDLVVHGAQIAAPDPTEWQVDFDAFANGPLPLVLPPSTNGTGSVQVEVSYNASDVAADAGALQWLSNDPLGRATDLGLAGRGTLFGTHDEHHTQPTIPKADVVLTVCDPGGSQYEAYEGRRAASMEPLVRALRASEQDYRVSVINDWYGCVRRDVQYIDASHSDPEGAAELAQALADCADHGRHCPARPIEKVDHATSTENVSAGGCNEGLFRKDAKLSVVTICPYPDQSLETWRYYVRTFQNLKADPDDVVVHGIAAGPPNGCFGDDLHYIYDERVDLVTAAMGGLLLSPCDADWSAHMKAIAEAAVQRLDSFELAQVPVPATIEVLVNGAQQPTGWSYDASSNEVIFDTAHTPPGGADVHFAYHLMPACEG